MPPKSASHLGWTAGSLRRSAQRWTHLMRHIRSHSFTAVSVLAFLAGCATADGKARLESEKQKYSFRKVAVFCTAPDDSAEDLAEAQIAEALKSKGINAYAKRVLLQGPQTKPMNEALIEQGVGYIFNFPCTGTGQLRTGLPKGCDLPTIKPLFFPGDDGLVFSPAPHYLKVLHEIAGERPPK